MFPMRSFPRSFVIVTSPAQAAAGSPQLLKLCFLRCRNAAPGHSALRARERSPAVGERVNEDQAVSVLGRHARSHELQRPPGAAVVADLDEDARRSWT